MTEIGLQEQKFLGPGADTHNEQIADYAEESLLKVYVYEKLNQDSYTVVTAPQSYAKINIIPEGNSLSASLQTTLHVDKEKNDERYFEALVEINAEGTLLKVNKGSLDATDFVNLESFTLVTNDFKLIEGDTPKYFTIREPFNGEAHRAGKQAVYYASFDTGFEITKKDIADIVDVDTMLMDDVEFTGMKLMSTQTWEKDTSKIQFVLGAGTLTNPKVDVDFGRFRITPNDETNTDIWVNGRIQLKWDPARRDFYYEGVQPPQAGKVKIYMGYGNPIVDHDPEDTDEYKKRWADYLLRFPQAKIWGVGGDQGNDVRDTITSAPLRLVTEAGVTITEFTLVGRVISDPVPLSEMEPGKSQPDSKWDIGIDTPLLAYTQNVYTGTKPMSGIEIEHNREAGISSITGKGINTLGEEVDLELKTQEDLIPLMVNIDDTNDHVSIFVPWFDSMLTAPYYYIKPLFGKPDGVTLDALLTNKEDRDLIYDLILMTKVFNDKLKWLPVEVDDKHDRGNVKASVKIGTTEYSASLLKGETAIQINDGMIKTWQEDYGLEDDSDRVLRVKGIISMLSRYIAISDAISGGNNPFNEAFLPWYLTPQINWVVATDKQAGGTSADKVLLYAPSTSSGGALQPADTLKFVVNSKHINIDDSTHSILGSRIKDLSAKRKLKGTNITLPKLPGKVSSMKQPVNAAHIDPTKDSSLSYILYFGLKDISAISDLFFDVKVRERKTPEDVTKTFTLEKVYSAAPNEDEVTKDIIQQVKDKYGILISKGDILSTGNLQTIVAQRRFEEVSASKSNPYPEWLYTAYGTVTYEAGRKAFWAENTNGYRGDHIGHFGWFGKMRVLSVIEPSLHDRNRYNDWSTQLTKASLVKLIKARYPQFASFKNIKVTNTDKLTVGINWDHQGYSPRWWEIKFNFEITSYKRVGVVIKLPLGKDFEEVTDRKSEFTKAQWFKYLANKDTYLVELYDRTTTKHTLYSEDDLKYITEIDIRYLYADYFNLKINGIDYKAPAFNKDDETLTSMKYILQ